MRVAIVGLGHVGVVTAATLASVGHQVAGVDIDTGKVARLGAGELPFFEPDLQRLLRSGLADGSLRFTSDASEAVPGARVVVVCVGRPPVGLGDKSLTAVEDAVRVVARHADPGVIVVVRSTVPPGTSARAREAIGQERPDLDFSVAASPEFLREGHAVEDSLRPPRVVVGADDQRSLAALEELFAPMLEGGAELIQTDPRSAELAKLAANAFLALKISYANALARLAERSQADIVDVASILGSDPRIGRAFLGAGLGFGGYCLPKDLVTLERVSERLGYDFALLREALRVNDEALDAVARLVEEAMWNVEGKTVALLGLAFKPGTDDVRSAPALALADRLLSEGARVVGHDPMASGAAARELPQLTIAPDPYVAAEGAHCVVVCTEWPEYRDLDLDRLGSSMTTRVMVDARNAVDPESARNAGFTYAAVGRSAGA